MEQLIDCLRGDLRNEYHHLHFYLQSAGLVTGLHRAELADMLTEHARSELGHVREFTEMITGLGHEPGPVAFREVLQYTDPLDVIRYAASMEAEVVVNYSLRLVQIAALPTDLRAVAADIDFLRTFYEEQLLHSRTDENHFRRMLR